MRVVASAIFHLTRQCVLHKTSRSLDNCRLSWSSSPHGSCRAQRGLSTRKSSQGVRNLGCSHWSGRALAPSLTVRRTKAAHIHTGWMQNACVPSATGGPTGLSLSKFSTEHQIGPPHRSTTSMAQEPELRSMLKAVGRRKSFRGREINPRNEHSFRAETPPLEQMEMINAHIFHHIEAVTTRGLSGLWRQLPAGWKAPMLT